MILLQYTTSFYTHQAIRTRLPVSTCAQGFIIYVESCSRPSLQIFHNFQNGTNELFKMFDHHFSYRQIEFVKELWNGRYRRNSWFTL